MHGLTYIDSIWRNQYAKYRQYRTEQGFLKQIKKEILVSHLDSRQRDQVDKFYLENYGRKIKYFWHEYYMGYNGKFDVQYIPEMIYMAEFEKFENYLQSYSTLLIDKSQFDLWAKGVGVQSPKITMSRNAGIYRKYDYIHDISRDFFVEYLGSAGKVFMKPATEVHGGGKGCLMAEFVSGYDQITGKSVEDIINTFSGDFLVQECIEQNQQLQALCPSSVNTFRIATYRWKDHFYHCPIILRMSKGDTFVDNVSSGGLFIAVDDDGYLHEKAFGKSGVIPFEKHPRTNVRFQGYKIDGVQKLIDTAIYCHEQIPQLGSINWDFTISVDGHPILVEANARNKGGASGSSQCAHGKAFFGDRTAEILRWLRVVKKTPLSKRKQYMFGYGVD